MNDVLIHYGILGMKWGVRRTPEQLGHKTLKKAKTANLEKWGKDEDHNILFVTGRSGGGKSTIAKTLADDDTDVIHLDLYFEVPDDTDFDNEFHSDSFNKFLKDKGVTAPGNYPKEGKEWNKALRPFEKALNEYGKEQYKQGKKVIAEGIQIIDDRIFGDKNYYKDKPVIVSQTNELSASIRAMLRDTGGINPSYVINRMKNSGWMDEPLRNFLEETNVSTGSDWVKQYLEERS